MSHVPASTAPLAEESLPAELLALRQRVLSQPTEVRAELEPIVDEALEEARFRGRVLCVARDALEQMRLDLEFARFDLEATRRERELLRERLRNTNELPDGEA
jgi:hypothetical protein